MGKILTISVAAYNVDKYLEKLLDSVLLAGALQEIEILVINDGSQDHTADIARRYEEQYPDTVCLVNKENGGHGSTINKGIELASGKYFKVIDGDDWVEPEDLKKLVAYMEDSSSDLILCNHKRVYESGQPDQIQKMQMESGREYTISDAADKLQGLCFHNSFYRTELLRERGIRITEHSFYVDTELVLYPLPFVNTVTWYDLTVYCYRLGLEGQSVAFSGYQKHIQEHYNIIQNLLKCYMEYKDLMSEGMASFYEVFIARMIDTHMYILFCYPPSTGRKSELIEFDDLIRKYPRIYASSIRKIVRVWRSCRSFLYYPICFWNYFKINFIPEFLKRQWKKYRRKKRK